MTIFRQDTANDEMISTLLEKKKMLESLHPDEITREDILYYKSLIELLINLNVYKKLY